MQQLTDTISKNLKVLSTNQNASELTNLYNETLSSGYNDFAPLTAKRIKLRKNFPWYNSELRSSKKLCRKLERIWKKSKLTVHKLAFKEQCARFNKLLTQSKRRYIQSSIENCKDNKKLHQIIAKLLKPNMSRHLPNDVSLAKLPDAFATFFQSKVGKNSHIFIS